MPSPFPCSPVIRKCSWKKTHIEKKKKKSTVTIKEVGECMTLLKKRIKCKIIRASNPQWDCPFGQFCRFSFKIWMLQIIDRDMIETTGCILKGLVFERAFNIRRGFVKVILKVSTHLQWCHHFLKIKDDGCPDAH